MKKILTYACTVIYLSFIIGHLSFVHADYMLPYPSYMPGNKLYRVSRMVDALNKWWYFGNISKVKYHLGLSDKYLVEAKTLFEYKQYLLGMDALNRSTEQFNKIYLYVQLAEKEGKDMSVFRKTIQEAIFAHDQVLENMKRDTPYDFRWQPEKQQSTELQLHDRLDEAIRARNITVK